MFICCFPLQGVLKVNGFRSTFYLFLWELMVVLVNDQTILRMVVTYIDPNKEEKHRELNYPKFPLISSLVHPNY
jgi:hypothetical protein